MYMKANCISMFVLLFSVFFYNPCLADDQSISHMFMEIYKGEQD